MHFSIQNNTKRRVPKAGLEEIKTEILGKDFELSLVFIGKRASRKLNKQYRGKDKPTNVLSFPISDKVGEIFIDIDTAEKESSTFQMKTGKFIKYLFIHGILHLKGMRHGARMDKTELQILNNGSSTNSSRHRHRKLLGKSDHR